MSVDEYVRALANNSHLPEVFKVGFLPLPQNDSVHLNKPTPHKLQQDRSQISEHATRANLVMQELEKYLDPQVPDSICARMIKERVEISFEQAARQEI